jgi:hypothetical protein
VRLAGRNLLVHRAEGWLTLTEAEEQLHINGITLGWPSNEEILKPSILWRTVLGSLNRRALETEKAVRFAERLCVGNVGNPETAYYRLLIKASSIFQRHSQMDEAY